MKRALVVLLLACAMLVGAITPAFADGAVPEECVTGNSTITLYPGDSGSICVGLTGTDVWAAELEVVNSNAGVIAISATSMHDGGAVWFWTDVVPGGWDGACAGDRCYFAGSQSAEFARVPVTLTGQGFATLTVSYVGPEGSAVISTVDPLLVDRDGFEVGSETGAVTVTFTHFSLVHGTAFYQGRLTHAGIEVQLKPQPTAPEVVYSAADGSFTFDGEEDVGLESRSYSVAANAGLYVYTPWKIFSHDQSVDTILGPVVLLAGDLNDSENIDVADIAIACGAFDTDPGDPGWLANCDVNADAHCGIGDLALTAGNFGVTITPWTL